MTTCTHYPSGFHQFKEDEPCKCGAIWNGAEPAIMPDDEVVEAELIDDIEVDDDGTITTRFADGGVLHGMSELPAPPRVVAGWDVAIAESPDGDKALLLVVRSEQGDVVLAMAPPMVGRLVDNLLAGIRSEL